jgi:hypothetical protein
MTATVVPAGGQGATSWAIGILVAVARRAIVGTHDLLEESQMAGLSCDKARRREMDASVVRRVRTGVAASRLLGRLFASRRCLRGRWNCCGEASGEASA